MPLIFVFGSVFYFALCYLAIRYVVSPGFVWLAAAAALAGVVTVVASLIATLAGVGKSAARTVGPDDVNDPRWFPKANSAFGRDRAWPHYLVAQAREDVQTAIRDSWTRHVKVWIPVHNWIWDELPLPLAWWPLLILLYGGLLAYTAGVIAAGVGLVSVIAASLLATWLGWLAVAGVAHGIDLLVRRIRRASASCPQCYHVTLLPSYRCECGQIHRDIRPGRLGALFRRCGCQRLLTTTVLRAARSMQALCPQCDQSLRPGAAVLTDVRLPVFGPVSAGKTRLIFAGLAALSQRIAAAGGELSPTDGYSQREYDDGVQVVTSNSDTAKTSAAQQPVAITVRIAHGERQGLLHVFDAAGEFFANREENARMRFLDQTQGLVFVVDPFSIPRVVDEVPATVLDDARPAKDDPETAYNITAQRLRDHRARMGSLAVTVVKADLLLDLPSAAGLVAESDSVRTWLVGKGLENMVLAAERDFAEVRYFLVSSWTGWRATDALTAAAPLVWLADRGGLPIPALQPIGEPP